MKRRRYAAPVLVGCLLVAACDTGDGKTLREPTGTLPPPTVATTTTTLPQEGVGTLPSLPQEDPATDIAVSAANIEPGAFRLIAPWLDGSEIDRRHTCDGEDISPALSWIAPPPGATELAIAVVDESIANGTPFVHWVVAGIDPNDISLIEGDVPLGAVQALNFFGNVGWGGPCPPPDDDAHIYRFTVYALNQQVELADGTPATDLLDFIEAVSVASADLTGTFGR